ncbi:MAG: hypothetical protein ABIH59_02245 [archaeon]
MTRMTKTQKKFLKVCKSIWPDAAREEDSRLIEIIKEKGVLGASFGSKVVEYLEANATLKKEESHTQRSLAGFVNSGGILGIQEKVYVVKDSEGNEVGEIEYTEAQSPSISYAAEIRLIGFDKKSANYRRLVRNFQSFANTEPDSHDWFRIIYFGLDKRNPDYLKNKQFIESNVEREKKHLNPRR